MSRDRGGRSRQRSRVRKQGMPSGHRGAGSVVRTDESLFLWLLILTILVGVVMQLVGDVIYQKFLFAIPRPLLIGLLFLLLSTVLVAVIHITSFRRGYYQDSILEDILPFENQLVVLAVLLVIIFLVATLFQFLYGLGGVRKGGAPTSYVFVIDDSGSMEANDPDQVRYHAVDEILEKHDDSFPYMVYGFASDVHLLRKMAPKSEGQETLAGKAEGGTSIKGALKRVISDYKTKKWSGEKRPRVVLLTDGAATDMTLRSSINGVLKDYRTQGISVSTVGLGSVDTKMMERIARGTGGVFISVKDASKLTNAMSSAAVLQSERDLVTTRYTDHLNILYAIMRIVFLAILGLLIGLAATVAYGDEDSKGIAALTTLITSVIGALVMEIGANGLSFSDVWMWREMWVLFAVTLVFKHPPMMRNSGAVVSGYGSGAGPANARQGGGPIGDGGRRENRGDRRRSLNY